MTTPADELAHAHAQITVRTYQPVIYDQPAGGPALSRIHVEETFSGDIAGEGVVEFLQAARALGSVVTFLASDAADWVTGQNIESTRQPRRTLRHGDSPYAVGIIRDAPRQACGDVGSTP
jgi:hypothetical protein